MKLIGLFCTVFFAAFAHEIVIQPDYWLGTECLNNAVPWQVPGSIYKEDEYCSKDDLVLEFGTGGSTLFFAKRCKHVLAIETHPEWAALVKQRILELGLDNVTLICMPRQEDIEKFLQDLDTQDITILSVDTVHGYNRSAFLGGFLKKGISENLKMVVLDNYGAPELFQQHHDKVVMDPKNWTAFTFDDVRWCGNGTKLYVRKSL